MTDTVIRLLDSIVQHGKHNDRVYLMSLSSADRDPTGPILRSLESLARQEGYSKIFCKIPSSLKRDFLSAGYREEAFVPGFFDGLEDASFMCRYFSESRMYDGSTEECLKVLDVALAKQHEKKQLLLTDDAVCDICTSDDVEEMGGLYREVFSTYPFPVFDPGYLQQTMSEGFIYFCIRSGGRIVALSSCEMDEANRNAEMTDFATLPEYRGRAYSQWLLNEMEAEMRRRSMCTVYTIARSRSYGMNITFSRNFYRYAGTLVNNTNISGGFESMNVWYKRI